MIQSVSRSAGRKYVVQMDDKFTELRKYGSTDIDVLRTLNYTGRHTTRSKPGQRNGIMLRQQQVARNDGDYDGHRGSRPYGELGERWNTWKEHHIGSDSIQRYGPTDCLSHLSSKPMLSSGTPLTCNLGTRGSRLMSFRRRSRRVCASMSSCTAHAVASTGRE